MKMCFTTFKKTTKKTAFLDYKIKKLKSRKTGMFPKGLVHGFGQKLAIFQSFYFRQNRPGKCVTSQIFKKEKDAFTDYKNKKLKKSRNWGFSKRVSPWFWSKIGISQSFYFRKNRPGKRVSRYSRKKKKTLF